MTGTSKQKNNCWLELVLAIPSGLLPYAPYVYALPAGSTACSLHRPQGGLPQRTSSHHASSVNAVKQQQQQQQHIVVACAQCCDDDVAAGCCSAAALYLLEHWRLLCIHTFLCRKAWFILGKSSKKQRCHAVAECTHLDVCILHHAVIRSEALRICVVVTNLSNSSFCFTAVAFQLIQLGLLELQLFQQLPNVSLLRLTPSSACRNMSHAVAGTVPWH
jgi:hypothetical protein